MSRFIARFLIATLPVWLAALQCPVDAHAGQQEMWTWVTRATGEMVDGKLTDAVASLARARRAHPQPEIDAMVGLIALRGGEPKLALRQLNSAIRKGSTEPTVFYWAGRAELARGRAGAALKRLREALSVGSHKPEIHMAHGLVLLSLGQTDKAVESLVAAAEREPNLLHPSLYPTPTEGAIRMMGYLLRDFPVKLQIRRTQGHLFWRAERGLAAREQFRAILSQVPADGDALQMLARFQVALGRSAPALKLANQAVDEAAGSAQALATRGEILLELDRPQAAAKDLRRAADAFPKDSRLLTRLAQACSEAEQTSCAEKFYRYALRRAPDVAAAYFGLALHLQQAGKPKQAAAAFERAVALNPGNARYYRAAAGLAHLQGHRRRARRLLAEARHVEQTVRRFKARTGRVTKVIERQLLVMETLDGPPPMDGSRRKSLLRLPVACRGFIQVHLALKRGARPAARVKMAEIISAFRPTQLLRRDPLVFTIKGKTLSRRQYELRRTFLLVPPRHFR
jgi:tetratricopeptide (TPR) repeat protein